MPRASGGDAADIVHALGDQDELDIALGVDSACGRLGKEGGRADLAQHLRRHDAPGQRARDRDHHESGRVAREQGEGAPEPGGREQKGGQRGGLPGGAGR